MPHRFFQLKNKRTLEVILAAIVIFTILYLTWLNSYDRISTITQNPGHYYNQQVMLRGKIGNAYALPTIGSIYYVTDDSGAGIWVVSRIDHAAVDQNVYLQGTVTPELMLKNDTLLGLMSKYKIDELGPFLIETSRDSALDSLKRLGL